MDVDIARLGVSVECICVLVCGLNSLSCQDRLHH